MASSDCHLYIIGARDGGAVKIGRSRNLRQRLSEIQTGSSVRVEVLWSHGGDHGAIRRLETRAHEALQEHRLVGEWFGVTIDHAQAVIAELLAAIPELPEPDREPKLPPPPEPIVFVTPERLTHRISLDDKLAIDRIIAADQAARDPTRALVRRLQEGKKRKRELREYARRAQELHTTAIEDALRTVFEGEGGE